MLVYSGIGSTPAGSGPVSQLSLNQRQTLYDYVPYILSAATQDKLRTKFYAPLPTSWRLGERLVVIDGSAAL